MVSSEWCVILNDLKVLSIWGDAIHDNSEQDNFNELTAARVIDL